jgi:arginine decarboxylase
MRKEFSMPRENRFSKTRIDQFFSGARADRWRDLVDAAKVWPDGAGDRAKFEAMLSKLAVTEEHRGYPGARLMASPQESAAEDDRRSKQGPDR